MHGLSYQGELIRVPRFYGWVIVAFTFVVQFVTVGLCYYSFSLYLKPLTEAMDTDRFWVSLALMIQSIVAAVLSPLAGRLYMTRPIKPLLFFGLVCLAAGFVSLSQVTALWQLYIFFGGLVGIGMVFLGVIPCNYLLANWFDKRRGTAMGISQFGITISATVLIPAVTWIVLNFGWELSFVVCGIAAFVILAPLIAFFAVRAPADLGQYPDGIQPTSEAPAGSPTSNWTIARAIRDRDIWAITFVVGPCYMGIAALVITMPAHFTDLGFTAMDAAFAVSATTLTGAIAKPVMGTLSDYLNKKLVMATALGLQAMGVVLLINMESYTTLLSAGLLFGLGYGGVAPLWGVLLAARFGRDSFAQIMGVNMPMLTPFNMIGLPFANHIFDVTGSYIPAYTALLIGYVISAAALVLFRQHSPEPQHAGA